MFRVPDCKSICLLKEYETEIELLLLEEDHSYEVTEFAHLDRNSLEFLTIAAVVVFVELQNLLVLVKSLPVFGLTL